VPGSLTIAATPIGNPGDASRRLTEALGSAALIAAEDTRRLRRLAADLDIQLSATVVSLFEGNEARRTPELVQSLLDGHDVLLVSDAGMPTVSDPGYRLVRECAAAGVVVRTLPGPSAVLAALAVSGLPTDQFCFEGFLPRKAGERARRLRELASDPRTTVFFESPRRAAATLAAMADGFGRDREAVVCRELTKTHEEVRRGALAELAEWADGGLLGEVTVVVAGATAATPDVDDGTLRTMVERQVAAGTSRRDAVEYVAGETGISRRRVYRAAHNGV
jgi:16S rRNA (cytidine1402-2'-O)-methyltransferase